MTRGGVLFDQIVSRTDLPVGRPRENPVQPFRKKYFALLIPEIRSMVSASRLGKRAYALSSRNVRRDAMDATARETNAGGEVVWSRHPDAGVK
jgi:hypothetical protein